MSNRREFIKHSVIFGGVITAGILPQNLLANKKLRKLTILHTNDMHCQLDPFPESDPKNPGKGGIVRIASLVAKERQLNKDLILLDCGDTFQGTPYFNFFRGDLIFKIMSKIGYDAGTIGNHEFDNGLDDIVSAINVSNFPLVSSNYDFSDTILNGKVKTHLILKKAGIKIGIYGLGIELNGLVNKNNYGNTKYLDPVQTAMKMESFLKNEHKCDLIICMSHLGLAYKNKTVSDSSLAPQTNYTNLIIGGHTHSFVDEPIVFKNSAGKPVLVNQAGWGTLALGKIEFYLDKERDV